MVVDVEAPQRRINQEYSIRRPNVEGLTPFPYVPLLLLYYDNIHVNSESFFQ